MKRICAFRDDNDFRCGQFAMLDRDPDSDLIIERKENPDNPETGGKESLQVYYHVISSQYCYYHDKMMKGLLNDSRDRNPKEARGKRRISL